MHVRLRTKHTQAVQFVGWFQDDERCCIPRFKHGIIESVSTDYPNWLRPATRALFEQPYETDGLGNKRLLTPSPFEVWRIINHKDPELWVGGTGELLKLKEGDWLVYSHPNSLRSFDNGQFTALFVAAPEIE
jgi:hypothetical protein